MGSMLQLVLDMFAPGDGVRPVAAPAPRGKPPARRRTRKPPQQPVQQPSGPAAQPVASLLGDEPAPLQIMQAPVWPSAPAGAPLAGAPSTGQTPHQPAAVPLKDVIHAVAFTHPQANAQVHLGDAVVAYLLRRARRRTIGFSVNAEGLVVHVPSWVTRAQVQEALQQKSGWIVRKLRETRERHVRMESSRITWRDGVVLPFLGQPMQVVLDPRHGFSGVGAMLHELPPSADGAPGAPRAALHLALPGHATADQIRDAVQAWLMRQARRIFTERLDHFAPLLGVQWKKLTLSSAGTRWGSARADGAIRLHWRLVHFRPEVMDYVVAHELSHLRVMDHSPRFWDTVATVVPDYAQLRGELRDDPVPSW
jgi:predicted metal-dependent hydrolase